MPAEIGHKVDLVEKSGRLAGQMYMAAFPPAKQEITQGSKYMIGRAERAGVNISLNTCMTAGRNQRRRIR